MPEEIELVLTPKQATDPAIWKEEVKKIMGHQKTYYPQIIRRSIDARQKQVKIRLRLRLNEEREPPLGANITPTDYPNVAQKSPILIIGAGPAGLFAALELIKLGLKPIILERGKDVQARRRDLAAIQKDHIVNPDSNYCFGAGGAGTYSDGKLYTRSKKRGAILPILETLVAHGAPADILIDAHPHIGTNKLPKVVAALRETIIQTGGEIHFGQRVNELIIKNGQIHAVRSNTGEKWEGNAVILATGHSARDIFELLVRQSIKIDAKPFALGLRIEHPQAYIDQAQYHCEQRDPYLPAASYSLTYQTQNISTQRAVYSFCMCPGGFIVPAATSPGEVVVNGMSPSRRDSKYANSGMVVGVSATDWVKFDKFGPLAAMKYQSAIEQQACKVAGNTQAAPAQRLMDFVNQKHSSSLPDASYQPGMTSIELSEVLPKPINQALREAFQAFGNKMKNYLTNEAVLLGVESRTSSPVKIPRDPKTLQHVQVKGLFPCGEGAGYAGGIMSAAMDGIRCAQGVRQMVRIN